MADDVEGLRAVGDGVGQRRVGCFVGHILLAGEEAHERAALLCDLVADGAAQHRIAAFQGVENAVLRNRRRYVKRNLGTDSGQRAQMRRQMNANHGSVCTSTDTTAGRSRTMGIQLSPESAEAYT